MNGRPEQQVTAAVGEYPVVRPIRKGVRIRRTPRPEDATTIRMQQLAQHWRSEAERLGQAAPGSDDHRAAICVAFALAQLPRNSLKCLISTLDEERDFALRCAELEILRAEHALAARQIDRLRVLENQHWWDSPTLKPRVEANNLKWDLIMSTTVAMAETPVRNRRHLELKRRLIGKIWLGAEGPRYDRMRAGVAADVAWLDRHRPASPRSGRRAAAG